MDSLLDEYMHDAPVDAAALHNVPLIEHLLRTAACQGRAYSYSELLLELGFRFTRPKMRTLCKTLDAVDARGQANGEPELAVLVVREGDRLPGQGWWTGRRDYQGAWTGPDAQAHIRKVQAKAFLHWKGRAPA